MPAFQSASFMNAGLERSKCFRGGLHQPPSLLSCAQLGGQRFVDVMVITGDLELQCGDSTHFIEKHCPHDEPFLNKVSLSAAVSVPYPLLCKFPKPHAPPEFKLDIQ